MHAILASLGTDGDVLPFIGLGAALRARGHRVTIAAADSYADTVAAHWLEFQSLLSDEAMRSLLGNPDFWHPIKTARSTAQWGGRLIEPHYRILKTLASAKDTILVASPAVFGASIAAETERRPLASVLLQPWMIPSAIAPPVMPVPLPKWAPRSLHHLLFRGASLAADLLAGPPLNKIRRNLGLQPIRNLLFNWLSPDLVLAMFPNWFGPRQDDWPAQIRLVGFPRFDAVIQRALPPGLPEFLSSPRPTVAFTFGSGMMHAPQIFDAATRICAQLNIQGLFLNRFQTPNPPAHMFHAAFVPFREIFPRCAAVVHHGGIGTTAEAFAAGAPQLIVPLGFDQLDNGLRVQRAGAGLHMGVKNHLVSRQTPLNDREINQFANQLRQLLSGQYRANSSACRERLSKENALPQAAEEIEKLFDSHTKNSDRPQQARSKAGEIFPSALKGGHRA